MGMERAPAEFRNLRDVMLDMLTSKQKLTQYHAKTKEYFADIDRRFDVQKERNDFGHWVAEYLDDAGYSSWIMYPDMYKAMVITPSPHWRIWTTAPLHGRRTSALLTTKRRCSSGWRSWTCTSHRAKQCAGSWLTTLVA